jgi:hypothetical protein
MLLTIAPATHPVAIHIPNSFPVPATVKKIKTSFIAAYINGFA